MFAYLALSSTNCEKAAVLLYDFTIALGSSRAWGGCAVGEAVMEALCTMRPPFALYEVDLYTLVERCFTEHALSFKHEVTIGRGCRIDYLIGDIGIEIKKGKPNRSLLMRQVKRYTACERVGSIIVVSWQSVSLPKTVNDKPVYTLSLSALWGVSLP